MKNTFIKIFSIVAIVFFIGMLSNCKKDRDCGVIVTVRYYHDTTIVVKGAMVTIYQGDILESDTSDFYGTVEFVFPNEAILDIRAEKDTSEQVYPTPPPPLEGAAVVRLEPGKTIHKTVFIQ